MLCKWLFRNSSSKDYIKCSCLLFLLSSYCPKVDTVNSLPEIFFIYKHLLGHRLMICVCHLIYYGYHFISVVKFLILLSVSYFIVWMSGNLFNYSCVVGIFRLFPFYKCEPLEPVSLHNCFGISYKVNSYVIPPLIYYIFCVYLMGLLWTKCQK